MIIQALSVVQPWGTHIAAGRKTLEIRSWRPDILPIENLLIVESERRLTTEGDVDLEGRAVAVVSIHEVHTWTPAEAEAACSQYEPGWLAWTIDNVRAIAQPFQILAARRLYEIEIADVLIAGYVR